jgi:DNA-binding transcriptional MerR regulator
MTLTVSKLADRVGLTADTIRYYERVGLLPPPDRTASGYRAFEDDAVERLRFIRGAQRIGLRLQEIKELLDIRDRGLCPCGHTEDLLSRRDDDGWRRSRAQNRGTIGSGVNRYTRVKIPWRSGTSDSRSTRSVRYESTA